MAVIIRWWNSQFICQNNTTFSTKRCNAVSTNTHHLPYPFIVHNRRPQTQLTIPVLITRHYCNGVVVNKYTSFIDVV